MAAADDRKFKFAVGGGLAAATYCGQWRDSKDLDLYTTEPDREQLIQLLTSLSFVDYFDQKPYDRKWIYRAWKDGTIIDVIWSMANARAKVDDGWINGPEVEIDGRTVHLLAPEEMIWNKLYVLQHDRCDWPDVLTVLYSIGADLDWRHLLHRLGEDASLLAGLLSVFAWLARVTPVRFLAGSGQSWGYESLARSRLIPLLNVLTSWIHEHGSALLQTSRPMFTIPIFHEESPDVDRHYESSGASRHRQNCMDGGCRNGISRSYIRTSRHGLLGD